ncbi:metallophosphoesterase [Helicobacter canis]|uniref:Metallophosphoesterase n=1 Tax=Helicobacter canis TaxID=29419 RepID=A0A5M9QKX6_9HELI|nr:metallophosphoesterase [Helicobacter canis]KAA8709068.1 metallophosphoesterase [Helicobacter canis]
MTLKILAIVAVIFSFLLGSKIYIYWRLSNASLIFSKYKRSLAGVLLLVFVCEVGFFIVAKDLRFHDISYSLLGLCVATTYCLFVACLCVDIVWLCGKALSMRLKSRSLESKAESKLGSSAQMSLSRRKFLKILHDLGVFGLFFLFFFTSRNNALHTPQVRNVQIPLPKLKQQKRIAMVSDVHIGHILKADFLARIVERINALNADVVVIVGDLIDDDIAKVGKELSALKELASKEGVFYVNGNHEYYHGIAPIMEFMRSSGVRVLDNEAIELEGFNLAGVNDLAGLRFGEYVPDLARTRQGLNASKPSILLAHQPKFVRRYDVSGFDLVLSGHTHAGQVFPMSIFVWLDQHYIHGLYQHTKDTKLYVSSGAGFWGPSFRFLAPSEIVCIDLVLESSAIA